MKIAIIPARGGSKRIPRKNIRNFLGKPIIAYAIETLLKSNLFDEVMVSTDDVEIAEISKQYGANVPFFRSEENSTDLAITFNVLEEVFTFYEKQNKVFEYACCVYPCTPLIKSTRLIECYYKLINTNFDCVFPLVQYTTPIQRAFKMQNEKIVMFNEENKNVSSQELEPAFFDAGQFYWFKTEPIRKYKTVLTPNTGSIVIDEFEAQDIDNEIDWKLAELKYKLL